MKLAADRFWYFVSGILFVAGCTAFGALRKCQGNVLAFRGPAMPLEIHRNAAHGEIDLTLVDKDGRVVQLSRTTSRIPTSIVELHVTCQIGVFPVRCEAPAGSELELGAKRILREWLQDARLEHGGRKQGFNVGIDESVADADIAAGAELLKWMERQ